jgi:hypothetical protein
MTFSALRSRVTRKDIVNPFRETQSLPELFEKCPSSPLRPLHPSPFSARQKRAHGTKGSVYEELVTQSQSVAYSRLSAGAGGNPLRRHKLATTKSFAA